MAIFGDVGKFFGLGDTKSVVSGFANTLGFNPIQSGIIGNAISGIGSTTATGGDKQQSVPTGSDTRSGDKGAQEDSSSGQNIINIGQGNVPTQGNIGNFATGLTQVGKFLSGRSGQIGSAIGLGGSLLFGGQDQQMKPVLTQSRRNKSKVRQLVNFMGIEGTANFLSQSGGRNVSPNDVVALLLRTFRNDGAFITKAQVRNLRRTTNRFKSLEKQVKEATSMTKTTRRSPVRRSSSTTLIRN